LASFDMHIHSLESDGGDPVSKIVKSVERSKKRIVSITDHNSKLGSTKARNLVKGNIILIPGTEISTFDKDRNLDVHILGYFYNTESTYLSGLIDFSKDERNGINKSRIELLNNIGVNITMKDVLKVANGKKFIAKPHFIKALARTNYLSLVKTEEEKDPKNFFRKSEIFFLLSRFIL